MFWFFSFSFFSRLRKEKNGFVGDLRSQMRYSVFHFDLTQQNRKEKWLFWFLQLFEPNFSLVLHFLLLRSSSSPKQEQNHSLDEVFMTLFNFSKNVTDLFGSSKLNSGENFRLETQRFVSRKKSFGSVFFANSLVQFTRKGIFCFSLCSLELNQRCALLFSFDVKMRTNREKYEKNIENKFSPTLSCIKTDLISIFRLINIIDEVISDGGGW